MQNSIQEIQEASIGTPYTRPPIVTNTVVLGNPDSVDGNLRMPLLLFADDGADTLVYIEPSPQQTAKGTPDESYRWVFGSQEKVQPIPHRIHSRKLLDTGSDVLKDLFRPRNQARVRKRYGLTNDMPSGVKYAIDLTPPSEGDEAVIFMTELSCPIGVRKWSQMQSRWSLPPSCVSGQDELEWILAEIDATNDPTVVKSNDTTTTIKQKNRAHQKENRQQVKQEENQPKANGNPQEEPEISRILNWTGNLPTLRADLDPTTSDSESDKSNLKQSTVSGESEPPKKITKRVPSLPLDYSPIRHRTCLERLLHAIEGLDPKLDTAPKLWTYFALAKILQVATHPAVGDHIMAWLYNQSNTIFIEMNPELAYQIACGLQNRALCQTSFAILVGEESLMVLESLINGEVPKRRARTIHGRLRESLDDTEVQRIEYSSKVFLDRILNEFVRLAGTRMDWVEDVVKENLSKAWFIDVAAHKPAVDELVDFCKLYVRGQICQLLMQPTTPNRGFGFLSEDATEYPGIDHYTYHSAIPRFCRVLTRDFWKSLTMDLPLLMDAYTWRHSSLKNLAPGLPILEDEGNATIGAIPKDEVAEAFSRFHNAIGQVSFDFFMFQMVVGRYLDKVASPIAGLPEYEHETHIPCEFPFEIVDTLVCLREEEYKFLPLWAGGNDDGTGGVFDGQFVPILEEGGFSTAGPAVHSSRGGGGAHYLDEVASMDSFESIRPDEAASTVQRASHEATASRAATTTVVSATSSVSEFELVDAVRDLGIKSVNGSVMTDDDAEMMMEDVDDDGFGDFDDEDDDVTIGGLSDLE